MHNIVVCDEYCEHAREQVAAGLIQQGDLPIPGVLSCPTMTDEDEKTLDSD